MTAEASGQRNQVAGSRGRTVEEKEERAKAERGGGLLRCSASARGPGNHPLPLGPGRIRVRAGTTAPRTDKARLQPDFVLVSSPERYTSYLYGQLQVVHSLMITQTMLASDCLLRCRMVLAANSLQDTSLLLLLCEHEVAGTPTDSQPWRDRVISSQITYSSWLVGVSFGFN